MANQKNKLGVQWLKRLAIPFLIIILIVSVIINFNLYSDKKELARETNMTWNNAISEFYSQANKATLHVAHIENMNLDLVDRKSQDLDLINQQLENFRNLPFAKEIVPYADRQKVKEFINYHQQVLEFVRKELTQGKAISSKNIDRLKAIHQGWEIIVRKLNTGENNVDSFDTEFNSDVWRNVWIDALTAFDQVELLPLPEKNK